MCFSLHQTWYRICMILHAAWCRAMSVLSQSKVTYIFHQSECPLMSSWIREAYLLMSQHQWENFDKPCEHADAPSPFLICHSGSPFRTYSQLSGLAPVQDASTPDKRSGDSKGTCAKEKDSPTMTSHQDAVINMQYAMWPWLKHAGSGQRAP